MFKYSNSSTTLWIGNIGVDNGRISLHQFFFHCCYGDSSSPLVCLLLRKSIQLAIHTVWWCCPCVQVMLSYGGFSLLLPLLQQVIYVNR